jgi:hypothetical protein
MYRPNRARGHVYSSDESWVRHCDCSSTVLYDVCSNARGDTVTASLEGKTKSRIRRLPVQRVKSLHEWKVCYVKENFRSKETGYIESGSEKLHKNGSFAPLATYTTWQFPLGHSLTLIANYGPLFQRFQCPILFSLHQLMTTVGQTAVLTQELNQANPQNHCRQRTNLK